MPGETNLPSLLKTMQPELNEGKYVFCTLPLPGITDLADIICSFKEKEGLTVVLDKAVADALGLTYTGTFAWITLTVHSSLQAVGLTAAFATALGKATISCNVIAAYYHDHIFVATADAAKAIKVLNQLSADNG